MDLSLSHTASDGGDDHLSTTSSLHHAHTAASSPTIRNARETSETQRTPETESFTLSNTSGQDPPPAVDSSVLSASNGHSEKLPGNRGEHRYLSAAENVLEEERDGAPQTNVTGKETFESSGDDSTKGPPPYDSQDEDEDEESPEAKAGEHRVCAVLPNLRGSSVPEVMFCNLCDDAATVAEGHCTECDQDMCGACIHRHSRMSLAANHTVTLFSPQDNDDEVVAPLPAPRSRSLRLHTRRGTMDVVEMCRKHREEKLRFFCLSCQQPVCRDCVLTAHKQHLTEDIGDATMAARTELSNMMGQLEQKKRLLESYLNVFDDYKADFQLSAQRVEQMMKSHYHEVQSALDTSYSEVTQELEQHKAKEAERIENQEMFVHDNIEDVTRLLNQQASIDSSIQVLSQHEVVSLALKTLDQNIQQIQLGQSEFLVSKNPRLTVTPHAQHFLGRVSFMTHIPCSQAPGPNIVTPRIVIREVALHRELAFNIWEMNCSKSSVRSIVETSQGLVWVATPRSLLKVGTTITRDSVNISDDIASVVRGPGDRLLVSFGQGNSIKLYASGSWSGFASVPKGSTVIASRVQLNHRLEVYVAVTSQRGTTKVLSYATDGKVCQQHPLPPEIFLAEDRRRDSTSSPDEQLQRTSARSSSSTSADLAALPGAESRPVASKVPSSSLKLSCMAVGVDGSLCLGDVGGARVVMVDGRGQLIGQYRGPDGQTGCQPRSVCVVGPGQVVLADSHRSAVELVSMEGQLLATLLARDAFQDIGVPTALTVDSKKRLWVGTSMGHVCAYSFLHS